MRIVLPTTYARTRIYRPRKEAVFEETFESVDVTDVRVTTDDGLHLHGWYALSRIDREGPRPLVIYFPGAAGHRGYRLAEFELFGRLGCDTLLVDYRGYGDNDGQPCERHLAADARRVWSFARKELRHSADRIVLCGESLGGGVAVRLSSELCEQQHPPAGLVLRSTFASMLDVASQFCPRFLANLFLVDRYPSLRRIRKVTCPLLSLHGQLDQLIPIEMGRRLFAAAPLTSRNGIAKRLLELPEADHNDLLDEAGEQVEAALETFIDRAVPLDTTPQPMSERAAVGLPLP